MPSDVVQIFDETYHELVELRATGAKINYENGVFTNTPFMIELEQHKRHKHNQLSQIFQEKRDNFNSTYGLLQVDMQSLVYLTANAQGDSETVEWVMANNDVINFTRSDFVAMVNDAVDYISAVTMYNITLKAAINICTDEAGLAAVNLNAGWP